MPERYYVLRDATNAQISDEKYIEWEEDPTEFDYVRVSARRAGTRQRGVEPPAGKRIGYAVLHPDVDNFGRPGVFYRRVFWVKPHDRCNEPDGCYQNHCPAEAIDPLTVEAGQRGYRTDRVVSDIYPSLRGENE